MDPNQINDVVAQVVAWHNRHPLACHITPWQVHNVGVVALPFVEDEPADAPHSEPGRRSESRPGMAGTDASKPFGSLRERAAAQNSPPGEGLSVFADPPEAPERPRPLAWWKRLGPKQLFRPRSAGGTGSRSGSVQRLRAVFSEDFIEPLSPARVARWSPDQGQFTRPGDFDWPLRDVPADPALLSQGKGAVGRPVTLYFPTAAVEVGGHRARVLVGRGRNPEVLGSRIWSPWRAGSAAALMLASLGLGGLGVMSARAPSPELADASAVAPVPVPVPVQAPKASAAESREPAPDSAAANLPQSTLVSGAAASAASAPVVALASESVPKVTLVPLTRTVRGPASAPGLSATPPAAMAASAPASMAAAVTLADMPSAPTRLPNADAPTLRGSVRPELDGALKAALKRQSEELRAQSLAERAAKPGAKPVEAAAAEGKQPASGTGSARATSAANASSVEAMPDDLKDIAKAGARVYALAARPTRVRAESEALLIQMRSSAANTRPPKGSRVEVLEVKNGWRAIWWPFLKREDAERARQALARRGLNAEIIDF